MGKLMNDEALYKRLDAVTANLQELTARLNQGQGTMGQLMTNKELHDNMNRTMMEMQNLLADIRKDPKKFLTVRMSIF
jgi:phospholipid/cholesterol/gamma-HCH transport system substrate-binding protein